MKKDNNSKINKLIIPILLVIIIILLVVILVIVVNNKNNINNSLVNTSNKNNNYITKEEAIDIALKNGKLESSNITDLDVELDYKYNQTVYEVTFDYQNYEYEYYINAETGIIVKSFVERD